MWMFLCFKLFLVVSVSAFITIDDKLDSPFSTDCFKRLSVGERLVVYDVTHTADGKTVRDCEQKCHTFKCSFFSFGISASGNGTCELSTRREIARRRDADYDIYQRTKYCTQGRPTGYEESCYRRLHIGRRLNDGHIRHSLPCDTLQACQHQCSVEQHFECHGFNIRLDESGVGRGICELASAPSSYLDTNRDFDHDPDFDYYEKDLKNTSPNCGYTNEIISIIPKNVGTTGVPYSPYVPDRRPWLQPSTSYNPNAIPNLNELTGKDRAYSAKPYDWPQGRSMGQSTVRLPGYFILDADENKNRNTVNRHRDHGRHLRPNFHSHQYPAPSPNWPNDPQRQICFQREYPAMRFRPNSIRESHTFHKVSDCENMCSAARFECAGFTFRYARLPDTSANCFLTDANQRDVPSLLIPDRDCDVYFRMPTCQQVSVPSDTDCFSQWTRGNALNINALKLRVDASSVSECELECLRSDSFICRSFSYRANRNGNNCYLSDWPVMFLSPNNLLPDDESVIYERGSFGRGCEWDIHPSSLPSYQHDKNTQISQNWGRNAWQHFTVRGWPCRRGTQCTLNNQVGFWSCQVEGGDLAQWDYCCRPQHACGYSQGYSYPWCYVGEAGPDQWRPCNENFYPDYNSQSNLPHRPWSSEHGPPTQWPISYLYPGPPPNETVYFHPNGNYQNLENTDAPKIQFRPSSPSNYPKAFVQKLDLKDTSQTVPQSVENTININPRKNFAKKLIFTTSGTGNGTQNFVEGNTFVDFTSVIPYINDTVTPTKINKTKAILDQIEKIIENGSNVTSEKMESRSSEGIGYARGFSYEPTSREDNAMTRFWNWGQESFFSNKRRRSQ